MLKTAERCKKGEKYHAFFASDSKNAIRQFVITALVHHLVNFHGEKRQIFSSENPLIY